MTGNHKYSDEIRTMYIAIIFTYMNEIVRSETRIQKAIRQDQLRVFLDEIEYWRFCRRELTKMEDQYINEP